MASGRVVRIVREGGKWELEVDFRAAKNQCETTAFITFTTHASSSCSPRPLCRLEVALEEAVVMTILFAVLGQQEDGWGHIHRAPFVPRDCSRIIVLNSIQQPVKHVQLVLRSKAI